MNVGVALPESNWVELEPGELEWQSEHGYYRIHHNLVTGKWHLARRLHPSTPLHLVGIYSGLEDAKDSAQAREASL